MYGTPARQCSLFNALHFLWVVFLLIYLVNQITNCSHIVGDSPEVFYNRPFARWCHFYYCDSLIESDHYFETLTPFIKSWTKYMENLYYFPPPPPPLHQIKDGKTARFGCRAASSVHDLRGGWRFTVLSIFILRKVVGLRKNSEFRFLVSQTRSQPRSHGCLLPVPTER